MAGRTFSAWRWTLPLGFAVTVAVLAAASGWAQPRTVKPLSTQDILVTNVIVEPTAEGAIGSQYIQVLTVGGKGNPPMIDHGGRYEDVYVKTAEGWRIKSRTYVRTFPPA